MTLVGEDTYCWQGKTEAVVQWTLHCRGGWVSITAGRGPLYPILLSRFGQRLDPPEGRSEQRQSAVDQQLMHEACAVNGNLTYASKCGLARVTVRSGRPRAPKLRVAIRRRNKGRVLETKVNRRSKKQRCRIQTD